MKKQAAGDSHSRPPPSTIKGNPNLDAQFSRNYNLGFSLARFKVKFLRKREASANPPHWRPA
jgi:hypothetical protein